jgi:hypothetical protein
MEKGGLLVGDVELAPFPPELVVPVEAEVCAGRRAIRFDRSRLVLERLRVNVSFDETERMIETGDVTEMPLLKYPLFWP